LFNTRPRSEETGVSTDQTTDVDYEPYDAEINLKRFPEWTADEDGARLAFTSTVRGWETLPVLV
jgi:hypothetical protein